MDVAPPFQTKAELRRAVIRTAARTHWKHDRTGARLIAAGVQDNDSWVSERDRISTIAFARQQASALPHFPLSCSGGGMTPCISAPERTLPCEIHSQRRSAPAGAAVIAASRSRASTPKADGVAVPALSHHSLHNGGNTHA